MSNTQTQTTPPADDTSDQQDLQDLADSDAALDLDWYRG